MIARASIVRLARRAGVGAALLGLVLALAGCPKPRSEHAAKPARVDKTERRKPNKPRKPRQHKSAHAKHEHDHEHPHAGSPHHHHAHPHPHLDGADGHHHPY